MQGRRTEDGGPITVFQSLDDDDNLGQLWVMHTEEFRVKHALEYNDCEHKDLGFQRRTKGPGGFVVCQDCKWVWTRESMEGER